MPNTAKKPGKKGFKLSTKDLLDAKKASRIVKKFTPVITNEKDYDAAVSMLDQLLIEIRGKEDHPLAPYIHILGTCIALYEEKHYPVAGASPTEVLKLLMTEHHLKQGDLPEIGNQAKVSEITQGKRQLNVRHIKALSKRFNVPPSVFF